MLEDNETMIESGGIAENVLPVLEYPVNGYCTAMNVKV